MQQPLERYGVVVLLFLVALVAVAIFWEDGAPAAGPEQLPELPLAQLDPVRERPRTPEPSIRPVDGRSSEAASRTDRLALSREADPEHVGRDQRTRTNSYGVTPRVQVTPESSEPLSAADSRGDVVGSMPLPRGDNSAASSFVGDRGRSEIADVYDSDRGGRDPLGVDLARAGGSDSERSSGSSSNGRALVVRTAPKAQPAASSVVAPRTVTVRDGDSLWRIAERELGNGNRWTELAEANGLRERDPLKVGVELRLPGTSAPETSAKVAAATPRSGNTVEASAPRNGGAASSDTSLGPNGARPYIVRSGDSLGLIAQRELGSVRHAASIQALNDMKSDVVMLDTRLWLPAVGTSPVSAPVAPVSAPVRPRAATPRAVEALAAAPKRAPRGEHYVR